jgi:hypothetical protein
MSEDRSDSTETSPFHYHLELTPEQLKITHTALRSLLDDFGHDQREVLDIIHEVLDKLPDEHAIRAIQLGGDTGARLEEVVEEAVEKPTPLSSDGTGDERPPSAA